MDYLEIRFELAKRGYTWARIARELDLAGGPSVSQVAKGTFPSERTERRIAEILEKPPHRVFPDRYRKGKQPGESIRKSKRSSGGIA